MNQRWSFVGGLIVLSIAGAGCGSDDSSTGSGGAGGSAASGGTAGSGGSAGSGGTAGSAGASGGGGAAGSGSGGVAGSGSGGAAGSASGGAGGSTGNKCQQCVACVQSHCGTEIAGCQADAACGAIYTCTAACSGKTADQCISDNPSGLSKWAVVSACLNKNCLSICQ